MSSVIVGERVLKLPTQMLIEQNQLHLMHHAIMHI